MGFLAFIFFPIWIIVFLILLVILLFIIWIWALIDCLTSRLSTPEKLFWIVIILIFHILGALLYFILSRKLGDKMVKTKNFKGKKLLRSRKNKVIAGVCSGIGNYFGIDPVVIRLLWVVLTIFSGFFMGILAYIIAWIIIPEGK